MFNLELDRVIAEVAKDECKAVMLQLPDGLKPRAKEIADSIEEKTGALCFIWFASCYGNCDIPLGLDQMGIDMFIHWGHNRFHKMEW